MADILRDAKGSRGVIVDSSSSNSNSNNNNESFLSQEAIQSLCSSLLMQLMQRKFVRKRKEQGGRNKTIAITNETVMQHDSLSSVDQRTTTNDNENKSGWLSMPVREGHTSAWTVGSGINHLWSWLRQRRAVKCERRASSRTAKVESSTMGKERRTQEKKNCLGQIVSSKVITSIRESTGGCRSERKKSASTMIITMRINDNQLTGLVWQSLRLGSRRRMQNRWSLAKSLHRRLVEFDANPSFRPGNKMPNAKVPTLEDETSNISETNMKISG